MPPTKRHIKTVSTFCANATGIWKMAQTKMPVNKGNFLPYNSESGPQRIGPSAKPSTKRLEPKTITSRLTWKLSLVAMVAELKTLLANVAANVNVESIMVITHFLVFVQFCGCSGSSDPFQSTKHWFA